jgi:GT2 family glycosyltransferase
MKSVDHALRYRSRVSAPRFDGAAPPETPPGVTAVVLTHRRPRLAGNVVRSLLAGERFSPERVIVVVSGEGGLDDGALEDSVRMVRLSSNLGPAGGFRTGLEAAFADDRTQWAYLCEDDVGLFNLPAPRVASVLERLGQFEHGGPEATGAVVAYGRRFTGRGHSVNVVPGPEDPSFVPVDVAAWGATLVSRHVLERGVLPDTEWFFGYEDFDFFCRVRAAGLRVLLDCDAARAVAHDQTDTGRTVALAAARPVDSEEPWRAYYVARNFFHLARAHGSFSWQAWHLAYSARRMQLAGSNAERRATVHGLVDGVRGRRGRHPRYSRSTGEY